jgi:adenylate cyclase
LRDPPLILAVDDVLENLEILRVRLEANGYVVTTAADGEEGLAAARKEMPDLILLDIMMPKRDGISVVRELKADPALRTIPVILVTAKSDTRDVVEGLDAGGDDFLSKPFEHSALLARVRSMLRQRLLHDRVQELAENLAAWNHSLEEKVAAQVGEIERINRLRRFLPEQVAHLIVNSSEADDPLKSHRREVTVVFSEYHACLGGLIDRHEGTLEKFMGDGAVVVFNDPLPCADHTERAVQMALAMREAVGELSMKWQRQGHSLGFGIGIARGHATIGKIGFDRRADYAVIGSVPNLAARLCEAAKAGEILISQRALAPIEALVEAQSLSELTLKGFHRPMNAFAIVRWLADRG